MKAKILIVDDEAAVGRLLADLLEDLGYEVQLARNGMEGLQRAREMRPTLIISDIMMPLMDGPGLVIELQKEPQLKKVPVVYMTAGTPPVKVPNPPVQAIWAKPFDFDAIEMWLENNLQQNYLS